MLHSTKSTDFSERYYFFIVGKMCFAVRWNGFARQIWPPGRSLENPDMNYEEERWQHTPLSKYKTNNERLYFNSGDTDTIFWAGIQLFEGQQEAPVNTVLQQHPQSFSQGTGHVLSRGRQHMCRPTFWAGSQHFSKIGWRVEICYVVLWARRKPHWVSSSIASIISPLSFFNELGIHSSKQRDTPVVGAFTPVSLVVYWDDQFANLSVPFQNAMTLDTHESAKPI